MSVADLGKKEVDFGRIIIKWEVGPSTASSYIVKGVDVNKYDHPLQVEVSWIEYTI